MRDLATAAYRLDIETDTATLTVGGLLTHHDLCAILARCRELPRHVIVLKVDLRPLGVMRGCDGDVVRAVLDTWRRARGGNFHLTTSHLVASCRQLAAPPMPAWSSSFPGGRAAHARRTSMRQLQPST